MPADRSAASLVAHDDPAFDADLTELLKKGQRRVRELEAAEAGALARLREIRLELRIHRDELQAVLDELADPSSMPLFADGKEAASGR